MRAPQSFVDEFSNSGKLRQLFSAKNLEAMGRKAGFIERVRGLTPSAFLHLCTFFPGADAYPTLGRMVGELRRFGIRMAGSSLWERFSGGAVGFMKAVFGEVLRLEFTNRHATPGLCSFTDVIIGDSSVFNLHPKCKGDFKGAGGGASEAAAKVQFSFGMLTSSVHEVLLRHKVGSDAGHVFKDIVAGALYLFDLGFFCAANFKAIAEGEAYFISRYKYGATLHHPDGRPIPMKALDRHVRMLKPGQTVDIEVLVSKGGKVPARLVMTKLPRAVGDGIRRKKRTDKQKKARNLSPGRMEFCDVNAYITNLPRERMPAENLRAVYGLRWQVEIMFKTWKSGLGLHRVRNVRSEVFQCFLYGGLIRMLLCFRLLWKAKIILWRTSAIELSEIKGMRQMGTCIGKIREWLVARKRRNKNFLSEIWRLLTKTCVKEAKKGDLTPFETIKYYA